MKVINKIDLLLLICSVKDRDTFDPDDITEILYTYGNDYFIEDGAFKVTERSKRMEQLRRRNQWLYDKLDDLIDQIQFN